MPLSLVPSSRPSPPTSSPTVPHRFHRPRLPWSLLLLVTASFAAVSQATAIPTTSSLPEPASCNFGVGSSTTSPSGSILPPSSTSAPPFPQQTLLLDTEVPVYENGAWTMISDEELELRRVKKRQAEESGSTSSRTTTTLATSVTSSATADESITVSVGAPTSTISETPSPLPSPLDSSLASNFTTNDGASCPRFINDMLTNPTFKACYPFSMLLQGSRSFFEAEKKLLSIVRVLDTSCAANVTFCANYLTGVARNLTSPANCADEYNKGNSVVMMAYAGLVSYHMLYSATCLQDPETSMYCFANAVTNLTTPANVYFYFLPLNMTLPGSATPGCNWCLQETMGIFQAATANRQQAIASTYESAAKQVNAICGPNFVNDTLPAAQAESGGTRALPLPQNWGATALMAALVAVAANALL